MNYIELKDQWTRDLSLKFALEYERGVMAGCRLTKVNALERAERLGLESRLAAAERRARTRLRLLKSAKVIVESPDLGDHDARTVLESLLEGLTWTGEENTAAPSTP
jgi:hypothetical protein